MNNRSSWFDREVCLAELLHTIPRIKIEAALRRTIGDVWRIVDADDVPILDSGLEVNGNQAEVPLTIEIEVIGRLVVPEIHRQHGEAATRWLEMVLTNAYRYRMAADLHLEAVNADHETLQQKHAALQESEARYRELAAQLEQRVKAQVEVIERAQRQLYQSEKMASVGSLAAGMAHEINNPVGFIRSNLNTASSYLDKMQNTLRTFRRGDKEQADSLWQQQDIDFVLDDFPGLVDESITGADRIARIVENLKAYASIDCGSSAAVDLNDAVRAAAAVVGDQLPGNIQIETDLQPLHPIVCDLSRMNQVMFSLLLNARQALGAGGGCIRIMSDMAGNEVRVAVSDNGCGIKQEVLPRIFDPFFTTRDVGQGMGLGLTVARDIVNVHGGRISVETAVGEGSTVFLYFPINNNERAT
ncbi:sensor histidine kinase [Noviherbaspirillum sp. Root189]|uniref:sensor histidine kinase n=1 Tax=Noviherbaspirillum sp. Root189 TaxID=1736487 RepID=UPI00070E6431|nr:ATP-binding protein [Noviherbaspirillum sp. Root189]KRB79539.1 hypothetical protein ASE07_25405 [Noviherbaspirillum sp. Root189]